MKIFMAIYPLYLVIVGVGVAKLLEWCAKR